MLEAAAFENRGSTRFYFSPIHFPAAKQKAEPNAVALYRVGGKKEQLACLSVRSLYIIYCHPYAPIPNTLDDGGRLRCINNTNNSLLSLVRSYHAAGPIQIRRALFCCHSLPRAIILRPLCTVPYSSKDDPLPPHRRRARL